MTTQAVACISTSALQHNLNEVRRYAPGSKVLAVIKANGYGHNLGSIISALSQSDAFAVGTLDEAETLRQQHDNHKPVIILQGVHDEASLEICLKHGYGVVVHHAHQIELLKSAAQKNTIPIWFKVDTGMHRLGFPSTDARQIQDNLKKLNVVHSLTLMSHLACADEPDRDENRQQLDRFVALADNFAGEKSLCNSAGLIAFGEHQYDWVRPGIMLYGISPLANKSASDLNLKPVMTLKSQIIAINDCAQGDKIGYGSTYECQQSMKVGVVGIGYGDGYPRHAPSGTSVLINGQRVPVVGRVSMDMITVDLSKVPDVAIGDEVILWGEGLPIEEIALAAGTIAYELVCRLTTRVMYQEVADGES